MADYDNFAPYYDQVLTDYSWALPFYKEMVQANPGNRQSILELGCGTGTILSFFQNDYELTGLDCSSEMLAVARRKLPRFNFVLGDMRNFDLEETFDFIICAHDSINHLLEFQDWEQVFECSRNHLKPNGRFLFDINPIGRLQKLTTVQGYHQNHQGTEIKLTVRKEENTPIFSFDLVLIKPSVEGHLETITDHLRQTAFPLSHIFQSLDSLFSSITILDERFNQIPEETDTHTITDKLFFECVR